MRKFLKNSFQYSYKDMPDYKTNDLQLFRYVGRIL